MRRSTGSNSSDSKLFLLLVGVIIVAVASFFLIWNSIKMNDLKEAYEKQLAEEKQRYDDLLKNKQRIDVAEDVNVVSTELNKYMIAAKDIIVDKYSYTNTDEYTKDKDFLFFEGAFEDKERITYAGEMGIGVDFESIKYDIDTQSKTIQINLPSLEIKSHDINSDSFRADSISDSMWVSSNSEEYEEYKLKLKLSEEKRAKENPNVWEKAKQHTEETFESFFKLSNTLNDYSVTFVWEGNAQEKQPDNMENNPAPTPALNANTCSTVVG